VERRTRTWNARDSWRIIRSRFGSDVLSCTAVTPFARLKQLDVTQRRTRCLVAFDICRMCMVMPPGTHWSQLTTTTTTKSLPTLEASTQPRWSWRSSLPRGIANRWELRQDSELIGNLYWSRSWDGMVLYQVTSTPAIDTGWPYISSRRRQGMERSTRLRHSRANDLIILHSYEDLCVLQKFLTLTTHVICLLCNVFQWRLRLHRVNLIVRWWSWYLLPRF